MGPSAAFETLADTLIRYGARDLTKRAVLVAWMDNEGVPMMSAERYRNDPAIRALFAERGVTLTDKTPPEDGAAIREANP